MLSESSQSESLSEQSCTARRDQVFMERSPAVVWSCLLGAGLILAFSVTTSQADPRPPQLIGCVFLDRANVTCSWEAGDTPTTHYTLQVHVMNNSKTTFTCTTSGTSCTARLNDQTVRAFFCTTITAHSRNQSVSSQPRCQSGRTEVMLRPVSLNNVTSVGGRPQCLNVTWSRSLDFFAVSTSEVKAGNLQSQIKFFTAQGQFDARVKSVKVSNYSFLVCHFRPDTSYTVRLRHRFQGPKSPWSPWSNARQGRTGEDASSAAPAFWRRVKQTDRNGRRLISLLWKPLPRFLANGRVLFFNVTCRIESTQVLSDHGSCRDLHNANTSCSLLLPAGHCACALTASTSAGISPEAWIWFRGASEKEPPPPSQITASPLDDRRFNVRWTAPVDRSPSGFVVEWFAVREKNSSSILHWEKLNSSCTALNITEGVKPMERYAVSVTALYGERGAGETKTVYSYTRQGAPSAGPIVVVQQISSSRVELVWSPVPVELLHGFLHNYAIYYKKTTADQPASIVTVPRDAHRYCLEDLSPGNYDIFIQANTDAGAGAAGPSVKVHIGSEEVSIVMYAILPLVLTSTVMVLMLCLAQNKMVKQTLCQDIPDPSNSSLAHWSPKITLESMKWPAMEEKTEIRYSEVILLGESEPWNPDPDQDLSYQSNFQTSTSHCSSLLPVSAPQTCVRSSTRAKTTSNTDLSSCPSIYSNILISQTLESLQTPLLSPSYLQSNPWQHSTVSLSDIDLQLDGDSEPSVSLQAARSDSPLSQTDELKTFNLFLRQHHSPVSLQSSSAEVTSPQHHFSQNLFNTFPLLQQDSDTFITYVLPFPRSAFVDLSYCPLECEPNISPAV